MVSQGLSKTRGYGQSAGSSTTRLVVESGIALRPGDGREPGEIGEEFGLQCKLAFDLFDGLSERIDKDIGMPIYISICP
jgi:hypothetical protein